MDFEQQLVSGAPERIYRPVTSLFEYRETVMQPGCAAAGKGPIHLSDFSVPLAPLGERLAFMGFGAA